MNLCIIIIINFFFQFDQRTLPLDIDNDVASNDSESSISGPRLSTEA